MYALIALYFAATIAALWGWFLNIVALVSDYSVMGDAELIIRIIGVPVAILGAFAGYLM